MTKTQTATCPKCNETLYSRAPHDFRYCSCRSIWVDGGLSHPRVGWNNYDKPRLKEVVLPYTKEELYADWNNREDKLGILTVETIETAVTAA